MTIDYILIQNFLLTNPNLYVKSTFITLGCSWYATTDIRHHGGCWCASANRRQAISRNNADSTITLVLHKSYNVTHLTDLTPQPFNKICSREVGRSVTRWFLCGPSSHTDEVHNDDVTQPSLRLKLLVPRLPLITDTFVRGIQSTVASPHTKGSVIRKAFPLSWRLNVIRNHTDIIFTFAGTYS